MHHIFRKLALLSFAAACLAGCGGNSTELTSNVGARPPLPPSVPLASPTGVSSSASTADADTDVTFTVTLDSTAGADQAVSISCSPSGSFTNLPSSVTVPAGSSSKSFTAHLSSGASGTVTVTATTNNVSKAVNVVARAIWGT